MKIIDQREVILPWRYLVKDPSVSSPLELKEFRLRLLLLLHLDTLGLTAACVLQIWNACENVHNADKMNVTGQ